MGRLKKQNRTERGFSFIEILVVMGIISVLVSMVVVIIPTIQENAAQTKSSDNVKQLSTMMLARAVKKGWKTFPYSGKNFTLAPIAHKDLEASEASNRAVFFSPNDILDGNTAEDEVWNSITKKSLKQGAEDYSDCTSYAGRRNGEREYAITASDMKKGVIILADDDVGPLHHPAGFVAAYSNGRAAFVEWDEYGLTEPEDDRNYDPWLGENAKNDDLAALSSD